MACEADTNWLLCLQIWEQEIAWSEADKPIKLVAKSMTDDSLSSQPIFCFETMMHLLYWSCLVYDYKRVHHPIFAKSSVAMPLLPW